NEIHEVAPVAPTKLARQLHHQTEVAEHQPFRIAAVTAAGVAFCQGLLLRRGHRRRPGEQSAVVIVEHHRRASGLGASPRRYTSWQSTQLFASAANSSAIAA